MPWAWRTSSRYPSSVHSWHARGCCCPMRMPGISLFQLHLLWRTLSSTLTAHTQTNLMTTLRELGGQLSSPKAFQVASKSSMGQRSSRVRTWRDGDAGLHGRTSRGRGCSLHPRTEAEGQVRHDVDWTPRQSRQLQYEVTSRKKIQLTWCLFSGRSQSTTTSECTCPGPPPTPSRGAPVG